MTAPLDELSPRPLTEPHVSRLPLAHPNRELILSEHTRAIERKMSGYIDPNTGLFATTALYLAQRGVCCNQGCRHCPYLL
ncbi:MAG: hypothetical protein JHD14_01795 [Ilumatobacteraceae bacterium]|nr:hypothetical protein [Ilumatobacteraceae bacterium]MBJ7487082.1 hypothetical protein [Ilumatobacteraceae bacterium]